MRYFIIGLLILLVISIVLYFILSRAYDFFSFRSSSYDIDRETRQSSYEEELKLKALNAEKERLTKAIELRSKHFQSMEEIKQLEKELSDVNDIIRSIKEN